MPWGDDDETACYNLVAVPESDAEEEGETIARPTFKHETNSRIERCPQWKSAIEIEKEKKKGSIDSTARSTSVCGQEDMCDSPCYEKHYSAFALPWQASTE